MFPRTADYDKQRRDQMENGEMCPVVRVHYTLHRTRQQT